MKILKIISNCFVSLLIVMMLILLFFAFSSKDNGITKFGKYSLLDVNGNSMKPLINDGDLIVIDTRVKETYEVGDVISFVKKVEGKMIVVTHEIVDVIYSGYVTEGQNNDEVDDWVVYSDEIVGEYTGFRIPFIGYIIEFSRTQVGYLLLIVLPLGLICFISIYELIRELGNKKGEA